MTTGKLGERFGQPGVRVDASDLAVLDQRGDDCPVVAALVGAREQGILAVEGQRSDRPLNGVGIELDAAIVEEDAEPVPAAERVAYVVAALHLSHDRQLLLQRPNLRRPGILRRTSRRPTGFRATRARVSSALVELLSSIQPTVCLNQPLMQGGQKTALTLHLM